jgi:hypothetical protein
VLFLGLFVSQGCKKPEDDLGLSVLDPADTLSTTRTDTVSIIAWPRTDDSVRTSGLSADLVGSYLDERFGAVTTATVTQFRLSVNNVGPADPSLACDSVILALAFADDPVYGDLDPQTIKVFRLAEDLSPDSIYTSDRLPVTDAQDLVQGSPRSFTPSPSTGPVIAGDTLVPQVRIPLNTDLGNEFLSQWGQATLADNASFLTYFKGLYIAPDNGAQPPLQAGVWRFNLLSGASKMTLYYHNGDGTASTFDFIIGTGAARYTYAGFDHAAATIPGVPEALLDTTAGQVETYVQAMGGIRTEVRFPTLSLYAGSTLQAVAKAELVMPISDVDFHPTYVPPPYVFLLRKADDGGDRLLPNEGETGYAYDPEAEEYRMNITRYVQEVINGTYPNTGLSLVSGSNGVSVNRATLSGPDRPDRPMRLVLTFTTY